MVCAHPDGNTAQDLCDMSGNLWEWVQDEWHRNYNGAPGEATGWCTADCPVNAGDPNYDPANSASRVRRGGGWDGAGTLRFRSTNRNFEDPQSQSNYLGGRLAR